MVLRFSLFLLLISMAIDPVLANKFETIGGGVSGLDREKVELIKQISFYAGCFSLLLGVITLLVRNRFEGFIGYASKKRSGVAAIKGSIGLGLFGLLLIGLSYL